MVRYARVPSPAFVALLERPGVLAPLLEPREVAGMRLDVHLREDDHVQLYCGLTRVLDVSHARGRIRVAAHESYTTQECGAALFRTWSVDEPGFAEAIDRYLASVVVNRRHIDREGAVQAAWAAVQSPWVPFDREAVIGYGEAAAQRAGRAFAAVAAARAEIEPLRVAGRWSPMPSDKVGAELDQLAVDSTGRLVLLELKDSTADGASVFYSPLQLLQYVHEWASAIDVVRTQLDALIEIRVRLGMSPAEMPRLVEGLRPVVAFGVDRRSAVVRERFESVREIVNRHLTDRASPLEVWEIEGGVPRRGHRVRNLLVSRTKARRRVVQSLVILDLDAEEAASLATDVLDEDVVRRLVAGVAEVGAAG